MPRALRSWRCLLVSAAGLLLRTMVHLAGVDPGFAPAHVVMLNVRDEAPRPPFGRVDDTAQKAVRAERYRIIGERLNALPGVQAASLSWLGLFSMQDIWLPLIDPDRSGDRPNARIDYVSARYFDTMGMQVVQGRGFADSDREGAARVAVINQTLARVRFGAADPLWPPHRARLSRRRAASIHGRRDRARFEVQRSARQPSQSDDVGSDRAGACTDLLDCTAHRAGRGTVSRAHRRGGVRATDPDIMVRKTTTLAAQVAEKTSRERLLLGLSSGFAALAIVLAAVGLYGTLAYMVSRRTREIGVRLALGARPATILRMILGDALQLAAIALVIGIPLSLAVGYSLRAFLFGVSPTDPVALAGACIVLTAAALLAAYRPARRAAAVDPIIALRCE